MLFLSLRKAFIYLILQSQISFLHHTILLVRQHVLDERTNLLLLNTGVNPLRSHFHHPISTAKEGHESIFIHNIILQHLPKHSNGTTISRRPIPTTLFVNLPKRIRTFFPRSRELIYARSKHWVCIRFPAFQATMNDTWRRLNAAGFRTWFSSHNVICIWERNSNTRKSSLNVFFWAFIGGKQFGAEREEVMYISSSMADALGGYSREKF